jgi:hypothetical protein
MTGQLDHSGFACREALEIQASMALLSGQYRAEQLGVAKDQHGSTHPLTLAEATERVANRSNGVTGARTAAVFNHQRTTLGIDDMASDKTKATKAAPKPKAPKAEATEAATRGRKPTNPSFKLTGEGSTNVRASSNRGQILAHLAELPGKKATTEELNATFGRNTLGDLRVLVRLGHLSELA